MDDSKYRKDLELIPGKFVGETHPCFIIAEIGQNHQGDINTAKKLIRIAKHCGADCVKFQKSYLDEKFTKSALKSSYTSYHSWGATYGEHKEFLEFTDDQFLYLKDYAENKVNIPFTASAMDPKSLSFLNEIDVPFIKIGSGEADNVSLLETAAYMKKPLVISTGMQNMISVMNIYKIVKSVHTNFALLHCVSSYPTEPQDVNLRIIQQYKSQFPDIQIGYSGHELGIGISIGAVALGAKVIERHITLSTKQKGSDHCCSLEPDDFSSLISGIRSLEQAMGVAEKSVLPCELKCYNKLYKTLVAARDMEIGDVIRERDIKVKVNLKKGLLPKQFYELIGQIVIKPIAEDENFLLSSLRRI